MTTRTPYFPNLEVPAFYRDELIDKMDIAKSISMTKAQLTSNIVYARQCEVIDLTDHDGWKQFLDANHLQGAPQHAKFVSGLVNGKGEILSIMTFSRHHRQGANDLFVLSRLATKLDTRVTGGASKMFRHMLDRNPHVNTVITWSDNRLSDGGVYAKLGFVIDERLRPDYFYIKDGIRRSKQSMKKSNTGCPPHITESQWATDHGYVRFWDAGKIRWKYARTK